jgi:hypothetical protein
MREVAVKKKPAGAKATQMSVKKKPAGNSREKNQRERTTDSHDSVTLRRCPDCLAPLASPSNCHPDCLARVDFLGDVITSTIVAPAAVAPAIVLDDRVSPYTS